MTIRTTRSRLIFVLLFVTVAPALGCASPKQPESGFWPPDAPYVVHETSPGRLMPEGWKLTNVTRSQAGREKIDGDPHDLALSFEGGTGRAVIVRERLRHKVTPLESMARELLRDLLAGSEVLAAPAPTTSERRERTELYEPAASVAVHEASVTGVAGVVLQRTVRATVTWLSAYDARVTSVRPLPTRGADAVELEVDRLPKGGERVDRKYYLALFRPPGSASVVVLLHGDVPDRFATTGPHVAGLARRMTF